MNWLGLKCALRLPQAGAGFKALALVLGALSASPALAQNEENRGPLFVCGTGADASERSLYLSGLQSDDGTFSDLRFDELVGADTALSYPPAGTDPKTAFLFSHSAGPEGYLVTLRFADQGRDYEIYSLATPPADPDNDEDMGGYSAGLDIRENGALVQQIACAERPTMFATYIRDVVGCDEANPLGAAACVEEPPTRTAPLNLDELGGAN